MTTKEGSLEELKWEMLHLRDDLKVITKNVNNEIYEYDRLGVDDPRRERDYAFYQGQLLIVEEVLDMIGVGEDD
ncbi:hypothetical protein NSQ26_09615 [Bacillus sp. FSL W7-1360]